MIIWPSLETATLTAAKRPFIEIPESRRARHELLTRQDQRPPSSSRTWSATLRFDLGCSDATTAEEMMSRMSDSFDLVSTPIGPFGLRATSTVIRSEDKI